MLDQRKPYILTTKGNGDGKWFGDGDDLPMVAIKCRIDYDDDGEPGLHLFYYDIGCERGHILPGKVIKEMKNGVVFRWEPDKGEPELFKLTEMTYDDFNRRIRPSLSEYVSRHIHDLDDVQVFYRRMVHMV